MRIDDGTLPFGDFDVQQCLQKLPCWPKLTISSQYNRLVINTRIFGPNSRT